MSRIVEVYECNCSCHREQGTLHIVACCEGKCKYCKKYITWKLKEHEEKCRLNGIKFVDFVRKS
jgi:hypothetical protein